MKFLSLSGPALRISLLFLSLAGTAPVFAQDKVWRPVTPDELSAKAALVEADADAEATFWEVRIDDSGDEDL